MNQPHALTSPSRRLVIGRIGALSALGMTATSPLWAQTKTPAGTQVEAALASPAWTALLARARGQTVYFNAWAGSEPINAYIQWAATQTLQRHGVKVEHVKIADAADVVKRVRAEKAAGKATGGSVDLIWINGENFLNMKREGLLFGPFAESLPHFAYVDVQGKPSTRLDFAEPTDGLESPWGMAQFTWFADRRRLPQPPQDMAALLALARAQPGRVTYPRPPNFHGSTFLKQALLELNPGTAARRALLQPVTEAAFASVGAPLWAWLDALHPHLWRNGRQFPANAGAQRQLMADGELLLALTFNPNEAANEIAAARLPDSVVSWQPAGGAIGNTHFVAIPFNSGAREGAQVFANFLLSPEAQARKADIAVWGDPTVLALAALPASERQRFAGSQRPGQLTQESPTLPEPHGSWVEALEREWLRRYGR